MKGGNGYIFRGRHVSVAVALVAIVLFSTLLWTWETNPITATLRSAHEWYHIPSGLYSFMQISCRFENNLCFVATAKTKAAFRVDKFFDRIGRSYFHYIRNKKKTYQ